MASRTVTVESKQLIVKIGDDTFNLNVAGQTRTFESETDNIIVEETDNDAFPSFSSTAFAVIE